MNWKAVILAVSAITLNGCELKDITPDKFTIGAPMESLDADRAVIGLHFNNTQP